jgi:ankyrin repeat protein
MNYTELQHGIEENLPIPDRDELAEAIKKGDLAKYRPEQIKEGLLQRDGTELNGTLYHWAAEAGHLKQIPKELLTEENLRLPDTCGWTTLHTATYNGHLAQVPKEFLTAENLLQTDWKNRKNCLHHAASTGLLHQIPKELLTEENLLQPDDEGKTCLHIAAKEGQLQKLPNEILTPKNLLQPDRGGRTCLHSAARLLELDKIPPLAYKTLQELKTYFETKDSSRYKEEILKTLNTEISKIELIKQSLKQDHKEIL